MQVIVIINSSAGTVANAGEGALTPGVVDRSCRRAGLYPEIQYIEPDHIAEAIREAAARRPDAIIVGGGDGTLNTAAGILADSGIPLGILPLGTLNHFSKDLNLPADFEQALAVASNGHAVPIDVAEVNGRIFINNCSIGAYPEAVRRRDRLREQRGHGKWWAMTLAWLDVLRHLRRLRLELKIDDVAHPRRTPLLLVSNNRYSGNLFSSNLRDHLDAGELWIYTTRAHRFFPLVRLAAMALLGRLDDASDFESWPARNAAVSLDGKKIKAGIDGELVELELPLHFRIRPGALLVLAPLVAAEVKAQ